MTSGTLNRVVLTLALLCAAATDALAQVEAPAPTPGSPEAVPEKIEPERPIGEPGAGESLSEQLEETRGVITPPKGIDPGVVEPTPDPGLFPTPVIPPAAVTPGAEPR